MRHCEVYYGPLSEPSSWLSPKVQLRSCFFRQRQEELHLWMFLRVRSASWLMLSSVLPGNTPKSMCIVIPPPLNDTNPVGAPTSAVLFFWKICLMTTMMVFTSTLFHFLHHQPQFSTKVENVFLICIHFHWFFSFCLIFCVFNPLFYFLHYLMEYLLLIVT